MNEHAHADNLALVLRPIDEIVQAARAAGKKAFNSTTAIETHWLDARSIWLDANLPNGMGITDEDFSEVLIAAADAFEEGIDELFRSLEESVSHE